MEGKEYYDFGISKGCDLNFFGDWQRNYAKLIIDISKVVKTASNYQKTSIFLDIGTACGLIPRAVKEYKMFKSVFGCDKNEYLINLGKETHGFNDEKDLYNQLFVFNLEDVILPFENDSVTLLHCSQTLEHVPEDKLEPIFAEFNRILHPEGVGIITVPTVSQERVDYREGGGDISHDDPTHISINTKKWWTAKFKKHLKLNPGIIIKWKASKHTPSNDPEQPATFYEVYKDQWTFFEIKKKG